MSDQFAFLDLGPSAATPHGVVATGGGVGQETTGADAGRVPRFTKTVKGVTPIGRRAFGRVAGSLTGLSLRWYESGAESVSDR